MLYLITFAADGFINGCSYYEGVSRPLIGGSPSPPLSQQKDDLLELLIQLGLEKYTTVFQEQEVNTNTHTHAHSLYVFTRQPVSQLITKSF